MTSAVVSLKNKLDDLPKATERFEPVILLSGGMDSIVNAKIAVDSVVRTPDAARAVFFDYGQVASASEAAAANEVASRLGIPLDIVWLPSLASVIVAENHVLTRNSATRYQKREQFEAMHDIVHLNEAWVPNRNMILVGLAGAIAEARRMTHVVVGFNKTEGGAFADNTPATLDVLNALLALTTRTRVRVISPTVNMTKAEILKFGHAIGAPLGAFYSCYRMTQSGLNCGHCQSCWRVRIALEEAGLMEEYKGRFVW